MTIDIKKLQKLINLCRKTGVSDLEVDGVKLKLSPNFVSKPLAKTKLKLSEAKLTPDYSEEDLMYWSSTGT